MPQHIFEILEAVHIYFLPAVPFLLTFLAEVAPGQTLAIRIAKSFDKALKEILYGIDGPGPFFVLNGRRFSRVVSVLISKYNRASKKRAADGLTRMNGPLITRGSPLKRKRLPIKFRPQNLQDGLSSGIAVRHDLNPLLPTFFQVIIRHNRLPSFLTKPIQKYGWLFRMNSNLIFDPA